MEENAQTQEKSKYPRFTFSEETDAVYIQNHQDGGPKCPFCNHELLIKDEIIESDRKHDIDRKWHCGNDNCQFYISEDLRNVYDALRESYSLDEAVSIVLEHCQAESDNRFKVTDRSSANWVLKKIAQAAAEMSDVDKMCDDEIAIINRRREQLKKSPEGTIQFFTIAYNEELEAFAKSELTGKKEKSVALIHGRIGFRSSKAKMVATDEAAAIAWAEKNAPTAVKKSLLISNVPKTAADESDAFKIIPASDKFYIEAKMPEVE